MKLQISQHPRQSGSVLLITLMLACILGVTLGGYLYWVRTQNLLVSESQTWNAALAYAEAGIEEGMAQINVAFGTNYGPSLNTNWPSASASLGAGVYGPRTGTFSNGSYSVIIITTTPYPTIISTGYAMVPIIGRQVSRTVAVTTTNMPAFGNGMAAEQNITFNGNQIDIDSYDSADPLHSTNGMYDAATRKAGGDVATLFGLVSVNNANINGKLYTGPTASYSVGANGYVGELSWTGPGIEGGWWQNDYNLDIKDVQLPDLSLFVPATAGITNTYLLASGGYYINGDLNLKTGDSVYVVGFATLYVTGNVNMQGSSSIIIAPGAQLKIYVAGPTAAFTSVNTSGNAFTFQYYGLPSNTSLSWNGNATYVGTVYAPEASFNCGGGGGTIYDYQGSCIVQSVSMNGHFNFHYDENLKRNGPPSGFTVNSWQEL